MFCSPFPLCPLKPKQPTSSSRPGRAALRGGDASLRPDRYGPKAADTHSWLRGRAARRAQSPWFPLPARTRHRTEGRPQATRSPPTPSQANPELPLSPCRVCKQPCVWGNLQPAGCTALYGDGAAAACPPPCPAAAAWAGRAAAQLCPIPSLQGSISRPFPRARRGSQGLGRGLAPQPGCSPLAAGCMQGSGRHLPSESSKLRPVRYKVGCGSQASGLILKEFSVWRGLGGGVGGGGLAFFERPGYLPVT